MNVKWHLLEAAKKYKKCLLLTNDFSLKGAERLRPMGHGVGMSK